ncbi:WhiB family transcriptional regulator [Mycolicibacterium moriokaense]|nr:WhiB family transcriptional regulator [Mycolicibacterium moriokaense]
MPSRAYFGPRPLQPINDVWAWQLHARCRSADPRIFFHPDGERGWQRRQRQNMAKAICGECPVRSECAEHAVTFGEHFGTWGGVSEDERNILLDRPRRRTGVTGSARSGPTT